ncbi:MmcQ/YjbR family DNA-binding protein [Nonomuraea lactucae]|uniref:MmcQ/YjbR family DNA-binding protein n=1 Tax=Nonomuraea lactucae TaxID=2249762 RepID=UPI000DE370BE|nr:MmcQ/YjbR family DNA-binding protein [Nonomuraea lactucae]
MITEEDVRREALALPGTSERSMYGTPAFYVDRKWFARIRDEGDVLVVLCASEEDKRELIAAQPETFFTTPHYDGYAAVLVRFGAVERDELAELLTDAWRLRAPKRLLKSWDAAR